MEDQHVLNGHLPLVIYTNTITFQKWAKKLSAPFSQKLQMGSLPNLAKRWGLWSRSALSVFLSIWLILPKWRTTFTFDHFFHFSGQFWHFLVDNSGTKYHFALILVLKVAVSNYTTAIWKKIILEKSIMAPQAAKDLPLKTKNSKFWNLGLHNSALLH